MRTREFYLEILEKLRDRGSAQVFTALSGENQGKKSFSRDHFPKETEVYQETLYRKPRAAVLGGGHVSLELVKILNMLEFQVTVADNRPEFAEKTRFPGAEVVCRDFGEWLEELPARAYEFYIIVTRGHKDDELCLRKILGKEYEYVGMIGSRKKAALTLERLEKSRVSLQRIREIHTPVGLSIGAVTPAEIAVSIAGEIIQVKNSRKRDILEERVAQGIRDCHCQVLVTVIEKKGSSPRGAGSRMGVFPGGVICGTIGGGAVEAAAIDYAKGMKEDFALQEYNLSNEAAAGLGMVCGGQVKVMFERL